MSDLAVLIVVGIVCFVFGYYTSMTYWYERADKGSLIEIKGKVYKLIEQEVEEKENGN